MSDTPDHEMPESADPIDRAYVQAEAVLSPETLGDAARAARRARLLAAVASEPATAASSAAPRRPARRDFGRGRGGWLAAACVAGLSVFVVIQIYQPVPRPPHVAPAAPVSPPLVTVRPPAAPAEVASKRPELGAAVPRSAPPALASPPIAPHPRSVPPAAPPSSPVIVAERRAPAADSGGYLAAPAPPPPAPPPPASNADASADSSASTTVTDEIVTRQRRAPAAPPKGSADSVSDSVVGDVVVTAERREPRAQTKVPVAVSAFTAAKRDLLGIQSVQALTAYPAKSLKPGAALRAAAAAGQTAEVETLLTQGTPIDAPDAKGDTALIVSIRADRPDVAAILRQHGASLDHRNQAGESARDLAKASGDAALGRALGLAP